jgi:hypothetical protein
MNILIIKEELLLSPRHTIVPEKSRFSVWFSVFSTETETRTDKISFSVFDLKKNTTFSS